MPLNKKEFIESRVSQGGEHNLWEYLEIIQDGEEGAWVIFPRGAVQAIVSFSFPDSTGEVTVETCHNTFTEMEDGIDDMVVEWAKKTVAQTALGLRDTAITDKITAIATAIRCVSISGRIKFTVRTS